MSAQAEPLLLFHQISISKTQSVVISDKLEKVITS